MLEETDTLSGYRFEKEHSNVEIPGLGEVRLIQMVKHFWDM